MSQPDPPGRPFGHACGNTRGVPRDNTRHHHSDLALDVRTTDGSTR
ncbi:hypothetical protein NMG29_26160 [Streptomyces cocklensis]|jgi:hypothetical protein|nr:hypothetical protein [Actinacidiphila cocklensis]MDD1061659.1 hypothetical protein [Actinacidiphila cocklensis]WSX77696.1 hypothetical protein OH826_29930 [Streptomyces sp. NBC_00899]